MNRREMYDRLEELIQNLGENTATDLEFREAMDLVAFMRDHPRATHLEALSGQSDVLIGGTMYSWREENF